jgi:glycosyltransferase involved in cell wall biosynthesis
VSTARLLVISPRFLFPLDQGGRIRTANTLRRMKGGAFHITLASPAPADAARFGDEIAAICDAFLSWPEPAMGFAGKVLALAGRDPVSVATDGSSEGRRVVARALAEQPDAVLVDFPHAAVLLPAALSVPAIMFTHNVEAEILERHAAVARGVRRVIWRDQARKMRRFEGEALRRFKRVIAVSERDAAALMRDYGLARVEAIETGVDTGYYAYRPAAGAAPAGGGTVVFTGAMDSRSNIDGIGFLMDEVWPLVLRERPAARAVIAGRNPPEGLMAEAKSRGLAWEFTGFVDDVRGFVAAADCYVIPLRVGSGTRMKVFEAMAMGCPVVSTRLGAEGLDVTDGEHLVFADGAAEFAAGILGVLGAFERARGMAGRARALVEQRFSWEIVTKRFERICLEGAGLA